MNSIKDSLLRFIIDPTLRVAVIKGKWGSGKTYFWKKFIEECKSSLQFRAYSYVSLFGLQDIASIRRQIFSNFDVLDEGKATKHLECLKPVARILSALDIPYINSSAAVNDLIEHKLVENFLICFDDFERMEETITASSVLGLISGLKEEKSCKIILIYNDEKLDSAPNMAINEYREKVVDIELTYNPSIENNLSIIWPLGCPDYVQKVFEDLNLNNIRIMQRVLWTQTYFADHFKEHYPHLSRALDYKAAVLTVLYHGYSNSFSLEEVLSTHYYTLLMTGDEDKKKRFEVLKILEYFPEDFDQVIGDYLTNGFVDYAPYAEMLTQKNEQYRLNNVAELHRAIWSKYHNGFVTQQDVFIKEQIDFMNSRFDDLGIRDIAETISFIKQLDPEQKLDELLDRAIDRFVDKLDNVDYLDSHSLQMKPDIVAKIQERLSRKTRDYPIAKLFNALAGSNGWNPRDIQHMNRFTAEDYYNWITTETELDVPSLVGEFLSRFGTNKDARQVIANIRIALDKIKVRSELDRCRVEYLIERIKKE